MLDFAKISQLLHKAGVYGTRSFGDVTGGAQQFRISTFASKKYRQSSTGVFEGFLRCRIWIIETVALMLPEIRLLLIVARNADQTGELGITTKLDGLSSTAHVTCQLQFSIAF